ncbi:MAG: hypothetical protein AAB416_03380 [Patescibacteria group bacterium]
MANTETTSMALARELLNREGLVENYFLEHSGGGDATIYQFWRSHAHAMFQRVSDLLEQKDESELGRIAACGRGTRVRLGTGKGDDPIPTKKVGTRTPRTRSVPAIHLPIRGGDPGYDGVTKLRLLAAQAVVADLKDLFKRTIKDQIARRHELSKEQELARA